MAVGEKWKNAGKNTGKAFGSFGKAMGKTMKVVFTDDSNKVEENGHTELSNAWRETGKGFEDMGDSLGDAFVETGDKIVHGDSEKEKKEETVTEEASEVVDK